MSLKDWKSEKTHQGAGKDSWIADCDSFRQTEAPTSDRQWNNETTTTYTSDIGETKQQGQGHDADYLTCQERVDLFVGADPLLARIVGSLRAILYFLTKLCFI